MSDSAKSYVRQLAGELVLVLGSGGSADNTVLAEFGSNYPAPPAVTTKSVLNTAGNKWAVGPEAATDRILDEDWVSHTVQRRALERECYKLGTVL